AIISLSEASTDFDGGDLTLTNATATLTGSGTSYTAVLTPTADGPVALSVAANMFTDAAGNQNTASNEVTTTFDGTAPTVSIAAFTGALNGPQTAIITLSEASTDFDGGDLTLTNATATLTGSGTSYTALLTPTADGPVALSVAANMFTDAAGNQNTASNEVTITADLTEPGVVLTTTQTLISGATTFDVTITFSEVVTGFDAGDIAVANGALTGFTGSGADYVATIAAAGGGDAGISVPAAAAKDAAGNPNMASNLLTISSATVEQTQEIIARFMQTRANMLISSQPDLTDFLANGSGPGSFDGQATDDGGSFNFVSAPSIRHNLWMRLNGSWANEDTSKSQYVFGVFGGHFAISPNLLIGGMAEFDHLGQDDGDAHIEGRGWMAGPYIVARLPNQPLFFEGRLLYGQTSNEISPFGTYTDRFDTERLLALAKVTGKLVYGATTFMPSLQFSHTADDQKAYTDSLANLIPAQGITLGQLEFGLDFRHLIALSDAARTLELTGGFAAITSWSDGTGYTQQVVPEYEGRRAKVKLGLNYTMDNGGALVLDGFYDGIGASGYESMGVKAGFKLGF
ncbi:Ig-like domain-containing protein, partial [Hoeflea sp.]|uniref:Ig-like domain-containing protein n=1 Tax=Hoeflea sp. TaxID=1940281 RepID=UPI0019CBF205